MGVPKFFRYMSERYPCLSEFVKEYQIPEFDNLYLDMNGIIHMCSHPDDGNPHFRITEERIFADIFHYIEVLFRMIKPQKVFFMAVDGVAPRAKMNQQRGRRFRSAKDAEKMELEAKKKGEVLPEEARFDSNCITPGTIFMARLHAQLKYFVVKKVSTDKLWKKCKIILSGHETPGEGEHKIMDYIRYMRSLPGYDPNTRHCLYGLDADLIMLGLCTHDPHFSLLREEVKFGRKASAKRNCVPEEIKFYLLHLSLMREYLELEFAAVKEKLISFEYDIEKIIDDWVLMGFLVGNDFIPHLPNLHITNGALPILYQAYMDILPTLDGYINEGGFLNLDRFEKFMNKLGDIDVQNFEETRDDLLYMEAKTGRKSEPFAKNISRSGKSEIQNVNEVQPAETEKCRDSDLDALIKATEELYFDSSDDTADEDDAFVSYKKYYYINKLDYKKVTPEVMRSQAEGYVRAIQWNLHYYYNGVCSWSWYYPHHYAPYISDIKGFSELKLEFDLGTPFKPYEQLLAVLPAASKNLLPTCYHHLMTDNSSPIKDYYPEDFETDLNGKKQDWEAVVLVPFIDENILLEAMSTCRDYLSPEEVKRNEHGPMLVYTHTQDNLGPYEAPMYFSNVTSNHAKLVALTIDEVRVPINKLVKGAYPGVLLDVYYPGFPTLKHLKYVGRLEKAKVKVFEQCSRSENMLIKILPLEKYSDDKIPVDLLGKIIYVGWPHLIEAKVVSISNSKERYISMGSQGQYNVEASPTTFRQEIDGVAEYYKTRMGIEFGKTKVLVKVQTMIGRRYMFTANGRVNLERDFSKQTSNYPLQSIVDDINVYTKQYAAFTDIESIFPVGSSCFTLSNPFYGAQGIVKEYKDTPSDRVKICISVMKEPDLSAIKRVEENIRKSYRTCYASASQLGMSNQVFSRITGSLFIVTRNRDSELKNVNIGLDLKFNKKNMETPGYTKKTGPTWYYSDKVIELANSYANQFPEVVQYLAKNNYNNNEDILLEEIFAYQSEERLQSLKEWMKKLPYRNVDKQICGSSVFEPEVVKVIEKIVDDFSNKKEGGFITMKIKPNKLYKPDIMIGNVAPDSNADVQLLDRVVNVREGYTVPLGLKGTVTAIHNSPIEFCDDQMFDVVFDSEFPGGIAVNCSPGRGYRLPKTAIINISYGLREYQQKTGKPGELMEVARVGETRSIPKNTYNANRQINQVYNQNVAQPGSAFAFYGYGNQPCTTQQYRGPPFPVNNNPMMNQYNQNYYQQQHQMPYVLPDNLQGPYIQPNFPQFCVGANSAYKGDALFYNRPVVINSRGNSGGQENMQPKVFLGESAATNVVKGKEEIKILTRKDNSDFMPQFQKNDNSAEIAAQEQTANALKKMLKIGISDSDKKMVKHFISTHDQKKPAHTSKPLENKQAPKSMKPLENRQPVISVKQKPKDDQVKGVDAAAIVPNSSSNGAHQNVTDLISTQDASVQLLNFYQSKGLGLPRYEYFSVEGKVQAKIRLPTRQVVIGSPGANREAASEIVAEKALETLNLKEHQEKTDAGHKPEPKNAVAHRQITKKSVGISDVRGPVPVQVNSLSKSSGKRHHKDNNSKKPSSSKINETLTNSFVPLQAIKHINKASSAAKTTVKIEDLDINQIDENFKLLQGSERNIVDDKQENARTEKKPRRVRKMRIAANFNMNK